VWPTKHLFHDELFELPGYPGRAGRLINRPVTVRTIRDIKHPRTGCTTLLLLSATTELLGNGGVGQFFPGVVLGLYSRRVTMPGVFLGIVIGVSVFVALALTKHDPFLGLNAGFLALCCNVAVVAVVSLLARTERGGFDENALASNLGLSPSD
jgi:hypothetical protein